MKIAVLTDSSAEISKEEALQKDIYVARMPLTIDGEEFLEEEDISRGELIKAMISGASVATSQPKVGTLIQMFDELLKTHDHIIFLPISSLLSGTYQTAVSLSQDYGGRITVVDSKYVSAPLLLAAEQVHIMVEQGMTPHAIRELVEREAYMYASLIPEDIIYLKRGGRISNTAAAVANLLKITPVLKVTEGSIDLAEKVRTYKKALKVGINKAFEKRDVSQHEWFVVDGDCDPEVLEEVVKEMEGRIGYRPQIRPMYAIVLAHTGPGTIAISCAKKLVKES